MSGLDSEDDDDETDTDVGPVTFHSVHKYVLNVIHNQELAREKSYQAVGANPNGKKK